jgi:hypothetical protein
MSTIKFHGVEYPIEFCSCCMLSCGIIPIVRENDAVECTNYQIIQKKMKKLYDEKTDKRE